MEVSTLHLLRVPDVPSYPQSAHAGRLETTFLVAPYPFSRSVKGCRRLLDNLDHGPQQEPRPVVGRNPDQHDPKRVLGITCFSRSVKQRWQRMNPSRWLATAKVGMAANTYPDGDGDESPWPSAWDEPRKEVS
ncbi:unnamed protein product [Fusarium equiseti]|uniref:Uncharacterized protein n=1 Tax=Fusarium equiseti TaxID=61235 RepID=A0A8J2IWF3_FUSEQ|nr:unnamed protein product [Fusarium equiseti]